MRLSQLRTQLPTLATLMLVFGCAGGGQHEQSPSTSTLTRNAQSCLPAPTLINPTINSPSDQQCWFRDLYSNKDSTNYITVSDVIALQKTNNTLILDVLDASVSPSLTDFSLLARLTSSLATDSEGKKLLANLEKAGHRLARVAQENPSDATWIQLTLQGGYWTPTGGRAARGNQVAIQELSEKGNRLQKTAIYPYLKEANFALAQAIFTAERPLLGVTCKKARGNSPARLKGEAHLKWI